MLLENNPGYPRVQRPLGQETVNILLALELVSPPSCIGHLLHREKKTLRRKSLTFFYSVELVQWAQKMCSTLLFLFPDQSFKIFMSRESAIIAAVCLFFMTYFLLVGGPLKRLWQGDIKPETC
jgi:hypothetical protein